MRKIRNEWTFRFCLPGLLLSALILFISSPVAAYERMDLLEEHAIAVRVSNAGRFLEALEKSGPGQLWNCPEMKGFLNNQNLATALKDTLIQSAYEGQKNRMELGHLLWQGLTILKGELVIALQINPEGEGFTFFAAVAIDEEDFSRFVKINERMEELEQDGTVSQRKTFQGVDIYYSQKKEPGQEPVLSTCYAYCNGTMVAGVSLEWVERCIARLQKEKPSSPQTAPTLLVKITDAFIINLIEENEPPGMDSAPPQATPSRKDLMEAFGLARLKSASLEITLHPGKMELAFDLLQHRDKPDSPKGLWTLFSETPLPRGYRIAYVPEDVYSYQMAQLDINGLWKEVFNIADALNPQGSAQFRGYLDMIGASMQIDISRDLFGNLGTLYTNYTRMEGLQKQDLIALQLLDPLVTQKLLAKIFGEGSMLHAQMRGMLEVQDIAGHKLYSIAPKKSTAYATLQKNESSTGNDLTLGFSVAGGALLMGSEKLVRAVVQASGDKKQSNRFYLSNDFKTMMKNMPEDSTGCALLDIGRMVKTFLDMMKNPTLIQNLKTKKNTEATTGKKTELSPIDSFLQNLKYDLLPPVEFMSSFFGKGISYTRVKNGDLLSRTTMKHPGKK